MYALPTEMVVAAEKTNLGIVHVVQYVRVTLNTFIQCLNENRRNAINIAYMYILCSKIIDNNILQQHHKERSVLTYFWLSKDTDLGFTMVVFKKKIHFIVMKMLKRQKVQLQPGSVHSL